MSSVVNVLSKEDVLNNHKKEKLQEKMLWGFSFIFSLLLSVKSFYFYTKELESYLNMIDFFISFVLAISIMTLMLFIFLLVITCKWHEFSFSKYDSVSPKECAEIFDWVNNYDDVKQYVLKVNENFREITNKEYYHLKRLATLNLNKNIENEQREKCNKLYNELA